jgi:C4-type Zn-finger protein
MAINISDVEPLAYCIAIRDLLDFERFQKGFGDVIILRYKVSDLESDIKKIKNELSLNPTKFSQGFKALIIGLLDKLYGIVEKYSAIDYSKTKEVQNSIKKIMRRIIFSDVQDFKFIYEDFVREIFLKVYEMFNESLKRKI